MTDKQLKPLPKQSLKQRVVAGLAAIAKGEEPSVGEPPPPAHEIVRQCWRTILIKYATGEPLEDIGRELKPWPLTGLEIRQAIASDLDLRDRFAEVKKHMAEHFVERAGAAAYKAERSGEYGVAINGYLKLAAKLDPGRYSDKLIHQGDPEAPIQHEHKGELEMSPSEAYKALLEGGR